jgi:hypothetical protein
MAVPLCCDVGFQFGAGGECPTGMKSLANRGT